VGYEIFLEDEDRPDWFSQETGTQKEWIGIISANQGYYYIQVYNTEGVAGGYVLTVDNEVLI
jgi:hypothetical protein